MNTNTYSFCVLATQLPKKIMVNLISRIALYIYMYTEYTYAKLRSLNRYTFLSTRTKTYTMQSQSDSRLIKRLE